MAESAGEKTEMPTPKKLRDARQKGQVCTSKDIVSTAILVVLFALLGWMGVALMDDMEELLRFLSGRIAENNEASVNESSAMTAIIICKHSFIFVLIAAVIGIVANVAQVGFLFTFEPIIPKLEKLNPVEGAKKIFSMKNIFEFLKNVVKVCFLSYLLYKIIWASVPELLTMCYGTVDDIFPCLKLMLKRLAVYTAFGYIVIAIVDRLFQGRNFTKQMMMTKDEVKREYKEMEGSQEVKQAQRQFRDEIMNGPDPASAAASSHLRTRRRQDGEDNPRNRPRRGDSDNGGQAARPRTLCGGQDRRLHTRLTHRTSCGSPEMGKADPGRPQGGGGTRQRYTGGTMNIEELYRTIAPRLTNWLVASGSSYHEACDIVQSTFLKLWKMRDDLRDDECSVSGLAFTMARNLRKNIARDNARITFVGEIRDADEGGDAEDADGEIAVNMSAATLPRDDSKSDAAYLRRRLNEAFSKLPPILREAYTLFQIGEMSIHDIANQTGISENLVKVRIFRAKEKLREILADLHVTY